MSIKENSKNQSLNSSVINFSLLEMKSEASMDKVLGERSEKKAMPQIKYVRRPRTIELLENGDVQFNVFAPRSNSVEVSGRPGTLWGTVKHTLSPKGDGWFSGVVSGIPAGYQYMSYFFDGVEMLNGNAPIGYGYSSCVNYVDIPDPTDDFYLLKDVPHGAVRSEIYFSSYTGKYRNCWVYTPPTYDTESAKKYPVWYIQHGGGENETSWFFQGKINYILDNLIAEGKCEEMIVVSNAGYAFPEDSNEEIFLPGDLGKLLMDDCIPFIEKRFRTFGDKSGRAMSGLSMGSYQTQSISCLYPELFDYLGIFSGATVMNIPGSFDATPYMDDAIKYNSQHKLLYFGKGMQEGGEQMLQEVEALRNRGIKCDTYTCPGVHEWQVWRKTAHDFAQKIFR